MCLRSNPTPKDRLWTEGHQTLTNLVVDLKGDVELQDDQHELEPWTHLFVGQRDVHSEHDVVGFDSLHHGLIKVSDLLALVWPPGHEPLPSRMIPLLVVYAFCGQVVDSRGGTGSLRPKEQQSNVKQNL